MSGFEHSVQKDARFAIWLADVMYLIPGYGVNKSRMNQRSDVKGAAQGCSAWHTFLLCRVGEADSMRRMGRLM